ncbi:hypothetical protein D3C87_2193940 [compost metagenome]
MKRDVLVNSLVQHIAQEQVGGLVEYKTETSLLIVLAHKDYSPFKIGIAQKRLGDEQASF